MLHWIVILQSLYHFWLDCPHAKLLVIIFLTISFLMSSLGAIIQTVHCRSLHSTRRWTKSCLLRTFGTLSNLSHPYKPLWTFYATQKHVFIIWYHLHKNTVAFQCLWYSFHVTDSEFWIYSVLMSIHRSSVLMILWYKESMYKRKYVIKRNG